MPGKTRGHIARRAQVRSSSVRDASIATPRTAGVEDAELVAQIAAEGFFDDPVMSWVFPDPSLRPEQLRLVYGAVVATFLPDQGTIHILEDSCTSMWRSPDYQHHRDNGDAQ